jgi:hypothetical protein
MTADMGPGRSDLDTPLVAAKARRVAVNGRSCGARLLRGRPFDLAGTCERARVNLNYSLRRLRTSISFPRRSRVRTLRIYKLQPGWLSDLSANVFGRAYRVLDINRAGAKVVPSPRPPCVKPICSHRGNPPPCGGKSD